jgi:transglutaminase-like putative cysteine protease
MSKGFWKAVIYIAVVFVFSTSAFAMHQLLPFRSLDAQPVTYNMDKPANTSINADILTVQRGDTAEEPQEEAIQDENKEVALPEITVNDTEQKDTQNIATTQATTTPVTESETTELPNTNADTSAVVETEMQETMEVVVEEKKTPANPYRWGSARDYRYLTSIVVKNTSVAVSNNVRIEVPLISSSSIYQSEKSETFSVQPAEIKTVSGTRVAVFQLGSLQPGEVVTIETKTAVHTANIEFPADYVPTDNNKSSSYLGASAGIESDNAEIINLSHQITSNITSDWDKAKAITRWVASNISYDASATNRNSGALLALQTRKGVCEDYAQLAAALARAANIPARIVYGYTDSGNTWPTSNDFALRGYRHAWVEFSLEGRGWVPADPTRSNSKLYFGTLPHNRYIIQNYSNISLKGGYTGGKLTISWADSLY